MSGSLVVLAAILALFTTATAIRDILWAFGMGPSSISKQGAQIGALIGVVVRTIILGAISLAMYRYGKSIIHPEKYSKSARLRNAVERLYAKEGLHDYKFSIDNLDAEYTSSTDGSLLEVYARIRRDVVPDKYEQLLYAIKTRIEKQSTAGKEHPNKAL